MTDYENAPATKLLATHCAVCARPLLDALSVEIGMGPDCRSKHGFSGKNAPPVSDDDRKKANKLVHEIACTTGVTSFDLRLVVDNIKALRELGFSLLAATLEARKARVSVLAHEDGSTMAVHVPFREDCLSAWRTVPGQRWDRETKRRLVPATQSARVALWALLRTFYGNELMLTEKGLVPIPSI